MARKKSPTRNYDCRRKLIAEGTIKSLKPGRTATDSLAGQGSGAILFEARASGRIESYFRTRTNGKSQKIKIGVFKKTEQSDGLTLEEIRTEAHKLSKIALEHGDVKNYLKEKKASEEQNKKQRELELLEASREIQAEATCGTLSELFEEYIDSIRDTRSERYIKELERVLKKHIKNDSPGIAKIKAKSIEPKHIYNILDPVWKNNSKGMTDKLRAYLHAAFEFGLKNDYSLKRKSNKKFYLKVNPVSFLPRDHKTPAITTHLNQRELHHFWHSIQSYHAIGPVVSRLFLFLIATGGQRIEQITREPWGSYDLEAGVLHTQHKKGNSPPRPHLIPLTKRSTYLLNEVKAINPNATHPWTTNGKDPINLRTLSDSIAKWLKSEHSFLDEKEFKKFTPRDLRRSCTQLMQSIKITGENSNILQCHGLSGVVAKHYNNNPLAFLPSLRETIEKYDEELERIIKGKYKSMPLTFS